MAFIPGWTSRNKAPWRSGGDRYSHSTSTKPFGKKRKPRAAAKRPALIEALEPRLLLAADGVPEAAIAVAVDAGLEKFGDMLGRITDPLAAPNTATIFDVSLPFVVLPQAGTTNAPSNNPVTLRDLLAIDAKNLGQQFNEAVTDGLVPRSDLGFPFASNPDRGVAPFLDDEPFDFILGQIDANKPTANDFRDALEAVHRSFNGVTIDLNNVTANVDQTNHRVEFTGTLVYSTTQPFFLEPGITAAQLGLTAQSGVQIPVSATLEIGFRFGLDISGTVTGDSLDVFGIDPNGQIANNDFYASVDSFKLGIDIHQPDIPDFAFNFGFLGTTVVDGSIQLDADAEMKNLQSLLGFGDSQLQSTATGSLTAANTPQTPVSIASAQVFDLKFGNLDPVHLTLQAGNYNSASALAAALDAAIDSSSLNNFVHAEVSGDGKVRFVADAFNASALGLGNGSTETSGTTSVTASTDITGQNIFLFNRTNGVPTSVNSIVEGYALSADQTFSLIVGENNPIKVVLSSAATADNNVIVTPTNGTDTLDLVQSRARLASDIEAAIDAALVAAGLNPNLVTATIGTNDRVTLTTTAGEAITVNERNFRLMPGRELSGTALDNATLEGAAFVQSGSGVAVLPLDFVLGSFDDADLGTGANRPTVTLTVANVFTSDTLTLPPSDPFSSATTLRAPVITYNAAAQQLEPFLNMTAQGFTSILDNLQSSLSAYSDSGIFNTVDLPFTENSLSSIFDLGDFFGDTLLIDDRDDGLYSDDEVSNFDNDVAKLIDTEGKTLIKTAQDFIAVAASQGVTVTPTYDIPGTALSFHIAMSGAIDSYSAGVNAAQGLGFVSGFYQSKTGIGGLTQQAVIAPQFLPSDGKLTQDATFVADYAGSSGPLTIRIFAADTADNVDANDLILDIAMALERAQAGILNFIDPGVVTDAQGNEYLAFVNSSNTAFSIDTRAERALPLAFDLSISPMENVVAQGNWSVDGSMNLDFTLALDLDKLGTGVSGNLFELTGATKLKDDLGLDSKRVLAIQAQDAPPSITVGGQEVYQLPAGTDVTFTLKLIGESGLPENFVVTLEAAETSTNRGVADLLADLKAALREAVDQNGDDVDITTIVDVDISAGRIVFTAASDGVSTLDFTPGSNVDRLGFGAGAMTGSHADLKITTRDGSTFVLTLDAVTTVQELINTVAAQTGNKVLVSISADKFALELVDQTAGTDVFAVEAVNGSPLALGLGWVMVNQPEIRLNGQTAPDPGFGGGAIAQISVNAKDGGTAVVQVGVSLGFGDTLATIVGKLASAFAQGTLVSSTIPGVSGTTIDLGSLGVSAQVENGVLSIKGLGDKVASLSIANVSGLNLLGFTSGQGSAVVSAGESIRGLDLHGDSYVVHATVSDMTLGGSYALGIQQEAPSIAPILEAAAATALSDFSLAADLVVQLTYTKFGSALPTTATLTLDADATANNATLADLVADLNSLFAANNLDDVVTATTRAGKLVIEGLTSQVTQLSVDFNSASDAALLGYSAAVNAGAVPTPYATLEGNLGFVGVEMAAHGGFSGSISVDVADTPLRLPEFMAAAQQEVLDSTTTLAGVGVDTTTIVNTMRIVASGAPANLNPGTVSFVLTVVDTVDLTNVDYTVNVTGSGNASLADLIADINAGFAATTDGNGDPLSLRFEAIAVDGKIAIAALSDEVDVLALRQPAAGTGPTALGFDFPVGTTALSGALADLRITLRDGTSFVVQLDGALTIGDVMQLIRTQQPSADLFEVAVDETRQRLSFRDLTTPIAGGQFKIENTNGATIGDELGIVTQTATDEILSTRLVDAYQVRSITDAPPTLTTTGTVTFDIGYDSRLVVPTMTLGPTPSLAVTFTNGGSLAIAGDFTFTPQAFTASYSGVSQLLALQSLTYEDVILGVSDVVSYVSQHLADYGAVKDKLPVIDQSLRDLFDFVKPFRDAEANFQSTFVANNIQGVQMALADAMNQPLVNSVITFTLDGGFLKGAIKFDFRNVAPQAIGIDVDAQLLPTLPGSREFGGRAGIPFDAQAQLNVDFGFDLATPQDVSLYDTTSFAGTILAQGDELAFLASVGPLAVLARSAEATLRTAANTPATFDIRVVDNRDGVADGRLKVATANKQDLTASISGDFEAFVPTFLKDGVTFVGIVEFDGTLAFKADGSGLDKSSWTVNMPPVLTGADPTFTSSFNIFDNFSLLVEGLDLFLLNVQDLLDGPRGLGVTLPLGGDELVEAGFFIEPIRAWAIEQLFALADTLVVTDEAAAFAAINDFLANTAFDVQVFGKAVTVSLNSSSVDSDSDGDFDRLEWDIALSQQDAVVDRVIPLDTLAPALQMEITGFLEVTVDWDFSFSMFLDAVEGFGILLSPAGTPEMHVALDAHLPVESSGVRITMPDGRIGLFAATFEDSRNATVITSITAQNLLNTAQTLTGNVVFTLGIDKTDDNVVNPVNYTVTVTQTNLQAGLSLADTNTSPLEYAINEALKTAKDASNNTVDLSGDVAAEFLDGRYVLTTNGLTVFNMKISGAGATALGFADGQEQARLYTYFKPSFTMDLFNGADPSDPTLFYGDLDNLAMITTVAATNLADLPSGVKLNQLVGSAIHDFDPAAFTFKIKLTDRAAGAVTEHSLAVQNTSGNASVDDLAQDLRDAIAAAGLAGKITVTVENGKIVMTPDSTLYKHIEAVEKGNALGFVDGQYVHVAPPNSAIAVLALDIDTEGAVAQGFLPGVFSKIDIIYAVTNVPLAQLVTADDPGLATGIVSMKFGQTLIEVSDLLNGLDQTLEVFEVIFGNPAIEAILKMLFEIPGLSELAGAPIGLIDLGFIYATYSAAKDGATSEELEKIVKRYENAKIFYAFVQSLVQLSRSINVDRSNGFTPFIKASEGFDLTFQLSSKDFRLANVPTLYAGNDTSGVFSYSVGSTSSKVDLSKRGELFSGKRQFSDDKVDLAKQFKTPDKPKPGEKPKLNRSKVKDTTARMMINDFGEGIDTPILTDAENQVIKMLLGVHGNLFAIDLPTVTIENFIEWKMNFFAGPIPLTLTIKLLFNVKLDFAFGWDTGGFYFSDTGLPTGNGADAADILIGKGTELTPKEISKADIPEISFQFIARIELGIGIPGISISIGAEIGFLINLDFHDANKDGKVQGPELAVGPTDVGLQITVSIYLKFTFLFFEQKINLISLKFDIFEHSNVTPFVAADMTGGTLRLNIGEFAWARFDGNIDDGEERWVVSGTSTMLTVEAFLNGTRIGSQSFAGITKIIGYAGAANDTIDLSGITDSSVSSRIYLGIGNDVFYGGAGNDTVYGEDGADTLIGNGGNDVLMGGAGRDRIEGNAGADALFGDTGLAVFALPVRLGGDGVSTTADLYRARVTGRDDSDVILGGGDADVIFGGGGRASQTNDIYLTGLLSNILTGTDLIDGGLGNDVILGDAGTVTLNAGIVFRVDDTNRGKGSSDIIAGGDGTDQIHGGRGDDYVFGQGGNDTIDGGRGRDFIEAGLGEDSARGGNDDDTIYGGKSEDAAAADGNDILLGDRGNDKIYGQKGDDFIDGGPNDDILYGQEGADRILGGRGVDIIFGGADSDIISGGAISDIIFGDDGLVAYLNRNATGILKFYGEGNTALVPPTLSGDRVAGSYEFLVTENKTSDGDDYLSGGEGDDIIFGGSGNDRIGGDLDVADPGSPTVAGSTAFPAFVPGVTLDSSGRDTLIGDGAFMQFSLFSPAVLETLRDLGGNDTLYGNRGEDIIAGGIGDDLAHGGHGDMAGVPAIVPSDTESDRDIMAGDNVRILYTMFPFQPSGKVFEIASSDIDASTAGADSLYGDAHDDIIIGGLGADSLTGGRAGLPADPNDGSDIIIGDQALIQTNTSVNIAFRDRFPLLFAQSKDPLLGSADNIFGSGGDDVLIGGVGADLISGGLGGDVAFGDEGRVDFTPTKITISGVDLYKGERIASGRTTDTLASAGGAGADTVHGDEGDDILFGGSLADSLFGDTDNDIAFGDTGRFVLTTAMPGTLRQRAELLESFDPADPLGLLPDLSALPGNDAISGGTGDDILFGGFDGDTVHGDANADIALGDNGRVVLAGGIVTQVLTTDIADGTGGFDTVFGDAGDDILAGGVRADTLRGNDGDDIVIGDNVDLTFFVSGPASFVQSIQTITPSLGGDDDIETDDNGAGDGHDIGVGGFGADMIRTFGGNDTAVGDNAQVTFLTGLVPVRALSFVGTTDPGIGGNDTIETGTGNDAALGGANDDTVTLGTGEDVGVGDEGQFSYVQVGAATRLSALVTTAYGIGGRDTITGNEGADLLVGGANADTLNGGDANDILVGDEAYASLPGGVLAYVTTIANSIGGSDTLIDGLGDDVVIGGAAGENIQVGPGNNVIFGDSAAANFVPSGGFITGVRLSVIQSVDPFAGGDDTIIGNEGNDVLVGGPGNDYLDGRGGSDAIMGDAGRVEFYSTGAYYIIESPFIFTGGNDTLIGGTGTDFMIGGYGSNFFYGDNIQDVLIGASGRIELRPDGFIIRVISAGMFGMDIITRDLFNSFGVDFEEEFAALLFPDDAMRQLLPSFADETEPLPSGTSEGPLGRIEQAQRQHWPSFLDFIPVPPPRPDVPPPLDQTPADLPPEPQLVPGVPPPPPLQGPVDPESVPVGTTRPRGGFIAPDLLDILAPGRIDTASLPEQGPDGTTVVDFTSALAGSLLVGAALRKRPQNEQRLAAALDDGSILELDDESGSLKPLALSVEWRSAV